MDIISKRSVQYGNVNNRLLEITQVPIIGALYFYNAKITQLETL